MNQPETPPPSVTAESQTTPSAPPPPARLDFKSGGWILLLSMVLVIALIGWRLSIIHQARQWQNDIAPSAASSNGFDLKTATVPVRLIGNRRLPDGSQALVNPIPLDAAALATLNDSKWTKYLVAEDRVIGVTINGESRAYPTRVLTWHEVANDVLGGVPIAVTYCPFSGGAAVYDRRVGVEELELRISGLVYNANLLLYDYQGERSQESLWSQLRGDAVVGPAAAERKSLTPLRCQLMYWKDWRVEHPDTTVMAGDIRLKKQYRTDPYVNYPLSRIVPFPHSPELPESEAEWVKESTLWLEVDGQSYLLGAHEIRNNLDAGGSWKTTLGTVPIVVYQRADKRLGTCSWVHSLDPERPIEASRFMYRFAWYALFSETRAASTSNRP